jgi:hypothetical protein
MNVLDVWRNHGTKILGTVSTIIAAIQSADYAVAEFLTKKEHAALALGMSIVGALTVHRGYENSNRNPPQ